MSEKAPRSNPRLENFEAKRAEKEREEFENALYGEAGTTDFSDEARRRVEEADEYERHMERLADETRSDYDRGLDRLESGEVESAAYNREWDAAIAEDEAFDAAKNAEKERGLAEDEALEQKFEENANLRQLDMISAEVHRLRNKEVTPETADEDERRLKELEDRLEELLLRYAESPNYDPALADLFVDRNDTDALDRAAVRALEEREAKSEKKADTEEDELDRADTPETPDDEDELDRAETPRVPGDEDELDDAKTPEVPEDEEDELDRAKVPEIPDDEEEGDDKDKKGDDADKTPEDDDTKELPKLTWKDKLRHPLAYLSSVLASRTPDRLELEDKKGKRAVILGLGIVAAAATAYSIYAMTKGMPTGGGDVSALPSPDAGSTPSPVDTTPVPTPEVPVPTSELPPSAGFNYPWDWAVEAYGAENAMSELHELSDKAAQDGHNVEWHGSGTRQWIEIDGDSRTKEVLDILRQYAE